MAPRFRRSVLPLLLAVLMVSAGCSALGPFEGQTEETLTPAAVPTEAPTLAPGVTAVGVVNTTALRAAHTDVINNQSYTVHLRRVVRFPNGTVHRGFHIVSHVGPNHTESLTTVTWFGVNRPARERRGFWSNDTLTVEAADYQNGTTIYTTADRHTRGLQQAFARPGGVYVTMLFENTNITNMNVIENTTRNGTTLYHVTVSDVQPPYQAVPPMNSEDIEILHVRIDSRGFVHQYKTGYTTQIANNTTVEVTSSVEYDNLSTATVDRPSWYEEATANSTQTK